MTSKNEIARIRRAYGHKRARTYKALTDINQLHLSDLKRRGPNA